MSASNPLTINHLAVQSAPFFETKSKVEKCANLLALVAAALFSIALITAAQPLIKSAFTGFIRYDTATIVVIPVAGGLGLICMLAYFQRKCAVNQIETPIEPENLTVLQGFRAAYDSSYELKNSFTLALNPDNGLRQTSIMSLPRNEYKNLVLRVLRDDYHLRTGVCSRPALIDELRQHTDCATVCQELAEYAPTGFLQLLT